MTQARQYDKNTGMVIMPGMPDDKWVAAGIAVMYDGENYSVVYEAVGHEHLPIPEIREELGSLIIQAWQAANHPGFTTEEEN